MIEYNPQITDSQYAEYAQGSMLERTIFLKKTVLSEVRLNEIYNNSTC